MTHPAHLHARLLHRIHRNYRTHHEMLAVGALRLAFTRVEDPDVVLDEVARQEDLRVRLNGHPSADEEVHLPYWAQLWDSAMGMGLHLERRRQGGSERVALNVLDLGCGMGLSGTVAAALGHRVMFADLEPAALLFARLNSLAYGDRIRTRRLNWRKDRLGERFDLILGADILYEREQWPWLEAFWREHLTAEGAILLGEPGRQTGRMFPDWLADRPWDLWQHQERMGGKPIHIFELRRR